jgi:hypothetical protein
MTAKAKSDEDRKRKALIKKAGMGSKDEGAKAGDAEVQADEEMGDDGVAGGDGPTHDGFFCNGCRMQPIVGTRYKCLEWDFFPRVSSIYTFTDDIVFSVALRAPITTCANPVRRVVSTPLIILCT